MKKFNATNPPAHGGLDYLDQKSHSPPRKNRTAHRRPFYMDLVQEVETKDPASLLCPTRHSFDVTRGKRINTTFMILVLPLCNGGSHLSKSQELIWTRMLLASSTLRLSVKLTRILLSADLTMSINGYAVKE